MQVNINIYIIIIFKKNVINKNKAIQFYFR